MMSYAIVNTSSHEGEDIIIKDNIDGVRAFRIRLKPGQMTSNITGPGWPNGKPIFVSYEEAEADKSKPFLMNGERVYPRVAVGFS